MKKPTATHACADGHDTLTRKSRVPPAGLGVGWTVQFVPSKCSASVFTADPPAATPPTAVHAFFPVAIHRVEGAVRWRRERPRLRPGPAVPGLGEGVEDAAALFVAADRHAEVHQRARHAVEAARDRAVRRLWKLVLPPQRPVLSGRTSSGRGMWLKPTPVHAVENVHDTPNRPLESIGRGDRGTPGSRRCRPTAGDRGLNGVLGEAADGHAAHLRGARHPAQVRAPGAAARLGDVCRAQLVPFQRAARPAPVAVHAFAVVQDTPLERAERAQARWPGCSSCCRSTPRRGRGSCCRSGTRPRPCTSSRPCR